MIFHLCLDVEMNVTNKLQILLLCDKFLWDKNGNKIPVLQNWHMNNDQNILWNSYDYHLTKLVSFLCKCWVVEDTISNIAKNFLKCQNSVVVNIHFMTTAVLEHAAINRLSSQLFNHAVWVIICSRLQHLPLHTSYSCTCCSW